MKLGTVWLGGRTIDDEGPDSAVTLNGTPLTPEESEACAVLVECMRRGWWFVPVKYPGDDWTITVDDLRDYEADTPTEAFNAALEAEVGS